MMTDKKTRGRRSKVDLLPAEIKSQLDMMLRDGRLQQQEILDVINQEITEETKKLSSSGLNRYATRMESIGAKIRQSREVAEMWTAKLGDAPTSEVGKLLQEVIRTMAFETGMAMTEGDEPVPPKAISQLALAIQRIEQAASASHKREAEIRKAFAEEAAQHVHDVAVQKGLSSEDAAFWRGEVLGVVQQ